MTEDDLQRFAVVVARSMATSTHRRVMTQLYKLAHHGLVEVAEVEHLLIDPHAFDVFDDPVVVALITELLAKVPR